MSFCICSVDMFLQCQPRGSGPRDDPLFCPTTGLSRRREEALPLKTTADQIIASNLLLRSTYYILHKLFSVYIFVVVLRDVRVLEVKIKIK